MLNAGKDLALVLQSLETSQSTYERWRAQYGGMKAAEAKRLKELEDENRRLKHGGGSVAGQPDAEAHQLGKLRVGRWISRGAVSVMRVGRVATSWR